MSRRGRSGPAISLFSFQDIITSVTAIVTVIALLLALDLVQKKQSQASDSSAEMAVILQERLEQVESELRQLQTAAATTDDLVRAAAATSPAELRNEIAQRESAIEELQRERARLEQQGARLKSQEKEKLAEQFDMQPLKDQRTQALRAAEVLEQQIAEEAADNRPIFTLPKGLQKEGWLAVISDREIAVAPIGRAARPLKFTASGIALFGSSAADNFEKWINEQRLSGAYFLLLVRPEGDEVFDSTQSMLSGKSISHGFDLISADQPILHPERGAVP
jgi:hypothetical protein